MRLGKALATGVAQEQDRAPEEQADLQVAEAVEEWEASIPEEVPAVR
ncbi:hypothetical protein ACFVYF_00700 [Streptomyces sp. NPDC058274]